MPYDQPRRVLAALVLTALFLPVLWFIGPGRQPDEHDLMDGVWTDPAGVEGNYLRIYLVESPASTAIPGVKIYEGRMTLHGVMGHDHLETGWNFESFRPLRLNVFVVPDVQFAAIRMPDANQLCIRFGKDLEALSRPDAVAHPETLRLVRTRLPEGAQGR